MLNIDPIWTPDTQQNQFRLLLDAMARPGVCHPLTILPKSGTVALAILATLLDAEVSLADPNTLLSDDDWLMLQVKTAQTTQADYIICDGRQSPSFTPKLGTLPSPDQSATLILVVEAIGQNGIEENKDNMCLTLTGPGIKNSNQLLIKGLNEQWLYKREDWVCAFPLGVDIVLIDDKQMVALPRTTNVEII
ncbi:MAG: alpha-D-ribose 1-methylphosphonate 5-triphosphate synthase subunit PhnH [Arenicella sp.]|jgi:alpha-D-ribose 1-methylphosphonate 5-triphosphate synthase subunit PhnH